MQNSLDRLFTGLARALHHDVLPHLTDPYARSQVTAAAEILGNLSTRVSWNDDVDATAIAELAEAAASGSDDPGLRARIIEALDVELGRMRSAKFGRDG